MAGEEAKRKKVTVHPIERDARGGPECYAILDRLLASVRDDLVMVKIALAWKSGWKPNKDGQLKAGKCCKPNEVSRQLMNYDVVILLNEEVWPHFEPLEKEELIYHELMHVAVVIDEASGEAKLDTRGRIVIRLRHHDIEEFHGSGSGTGKRTSRRRSSGSGPSSRSRSCLRRKSLERHPRKRRGRHEQKHNRSARGSERPRVLAVFRAGQGRHQDRHARTAGD